MRSLPQTAAAALACLLTTWSPASGVGAGTAALAAKIPAALPAASSFALPEAGAESHEGLPQWRRVLRGVTAEEPAYVECKGGGACQSRAVREWLALLDRLGRIAAA